MAQTEHEATESPLRQAAEAVHNRIRRHAALLAKMMEDVGGPAELR